MRLQPKLRGFGSTSLYIRRDEYEPELLAVRRFVAPGSVVVDIGGSFGVFALFLSEFVGPAGEVHVFEPGGFSFSQLSANVALNGRGNRVHLHNAAASDAPGTLSLFHLHDSPVNFSIGGADGVESESVPAVRVDDVVPEAQWPRVSFIKIDVEGFEQTALQGAERLIKRAHPAIMFEVSESALARLGRQTADIYDYLAGFGYTFSVLDDDRNLVPATRGQEGNIFALADRAVRR